MAVVVAINETDSLLLFCASSSARGQILVDDLEQAGLDRRELVAQLYHALMESLSKALQSNQPAAAVSACRAIADIFQLAPVPRRPRNS